MFSFRITCFPLGVGSGDECWKYSVNRVEKSVLFKLAVTGDGVPLALALQNDPFRTG